MCIVGQQRLITLMLLPRNVARVMIPKQDRPVLNRLAMADRLPGASSDHPGASFGLAERIAASVHRIAEHVPDRVVDR